MKHIFIIFSLTGILLQTFYSGIILTNFVVNQDFIAKNLCENKDKPMMHCNGKCHLRKQLAEQQKKDNAPSQNFKEKIEVQFFSESIVEFEILSPEKTSLNSSYHFFIPKTALQSIFHPPQQPVFIS